MRTDEAVRYELSHGKTRVEDRTLHKMTDGMERPEFANPMELWFVRSAEEVEQLKRVAPSAGYSATVIVEGIPGKRLWLVGLEKLEAA